MTRYTFTELEALRLHRLIDSHVKALHNWLESAVNSDDFEKAKELAQELKVYRGLYARTNVESHRLIEASKVVAYDIARK